MINLIAPFMEKLIQGQPGWGAPQPRKKSNEIQLFREKNMSNNWISLIFLGGWGAPQPPKKSNEIQLFDVFS